MTDYHAGPLGALERAMETKAETTDVRFTDARTPTAHAASHATGGSDQVTPASIGAASDAEGALAVTAVQPEDLATVATSGAYSDLSGTPVIPAPGGRVDEVVAGSGVSVDGSDPSRPVVSADGGGAVDSVNGQTGVVVLDDRDVGAIPVEAVGLVPGETNRGLWDAGATYVAGDVVFDPDPPGSAWVAVTPTVGVSPAAPAWTDIGARARVALGAGTTASGDAVTAVGLGATASGDAATAVGLGATASGDAATAVGLAATASGDYATAVGSVATASGEAATAVGSGVSAPNPGDVNLGNVLKGGIDTSTYQSDRPVTLPYGALDLPTSPDATNPAAGTTRLVGRAGGIYVRDSAGVEVGPIGAGGGGTLTPRMSIMTAMNDIDSTHIGYTFATAPALGSRLYCIVERESSTASSSPAMTGVTFSTLSHDSLTANAGFDLYVGSVGSGAGTSLSVTVPSGAYALGHMVVFDPLDGTQDGTLSSKASFDAGSADYNPQWTALWSSPQAISLVAVCGGGVGTVHVTPQANGVTAGYVSRKVARGVYVCQGLVSVAFYADGITLPKGMRYELGTP